MSRHESLAGDPRVRWSFLANTYSTGWFWYPRGYGLLHCTDGLLQFEPTSSLPFRTPAPFRHTYRRVLLLSPFGIPNHFTVVVFEGGLVSVSIARNRERIRSVLAECGFDVVDAPPQRMYPFNQRKAWDTHMGEPAGAAAAAKAELVLGGVDRPMTVQVPCRACGAPIELEYHDIQARWYRASATPGTRPGWQWADAARAIAADETALDMSCPRCVVPMRVIVHANEWRMSIYQFRIVDVLARTAEQPDG